MNLLLDTHIALWAITDSPRLSVAARELIVNPRAGIWISAASLWEIAIKQQLPRGNMPISAHAALGYFRAAGYSILAIEPEHAIAVAQLPMHHQDPFDRLLIAQALVEPMRLLTHDQMLGAYSDSIVLV